MAVSRRIGITINETIRDFLNSVDFAYQCYTAIPVSENIEGESIELEEPKDLSHLSLDVDIDSLDDSMLPSVVEKTKYLLNLDKSDDLFEISKLYPFESKEEYQSFLYEDMAFNIFGRANLIYDEAMDDLHKLYSSFVEDGHEVSLVSQERGNSKSATLLFLSQNKFQGNNIKFLYNYTNIWDLYDIIVTAEPSIIDSKPENKLCFKINCKGNENSNGTLDFDNLFDVNKFYNKNKKR